MSAGQRPAGQRFSCRCASYSSRKYLSVVSDRIGRGLAEPAQAAAADVVGQRRERLQVVGPAVALAEPVEDLQHPLGADAAERALAARLGLREAQEEARDVHHAVAIVEHDQAAGAHDGARRRQRVVVHRRVGQARRDAAAGRPADLHGLERPAVLDAAADLLDDLADGDPHRHFDQAAVVDLAGEREHLRALAGSGAERGERVGAVAEDPRHAGERLDVVDEGRLSAEAAFGGIGRAQRRHAAPAFERLDQRGLLAAHERAGAFADLEAQRERRTEDALAQQAALLGLLDRGADAPHGQRIFGADVEEAFAWRRPRTRRSRVPRCTRCGSRFEHQAVHERAGIAFVAVADHVLDPARAGARAIAHLRPVGKPAPPRPRRPEAMIAAMTSSGGVPFTARRERAVAVAREVVVDVQRVDLAAVLEHDALLLAEIRGGRAGAAIEADGVHGDGGIRHGDPAAASARQRAQAASVRGDALCARAARRHVAVQRGAAVGLDDFDHRLAVAHAVAADGLDDAVRAGLARRLDERGAHGLAAAGNAAGAEPDADLDGGGAHAGSASRATPSSASARGGRRQPAGRVSSTISTGARLQQPRHATSSSVNRRAGSVSAPSGMPQVAAQLSVIWRAPATWQAVPWQTRTTCSPTGDRRNCA